MLVRKQTIGFIALLSALLISACGGADAVGTAATEATDFPQFSAATIDGAQLEFGSLEGQDALLWFWAPW